MEQVPAPGKVSGWRRRLTLSAAVLAVLLLMQGVRYLRGGRLSASAAPGAEVLREAPERDEAPDLKDYEAITAEGHFGKKKPPPRPQLFGVLGKYALLGNSPDKAEMHEAGAKLPGGYVLVEIGADQVVLEKDGKKETVKLFGDPIPRGAPEKPSGAEDEEKGAPPEGPADATGAEAPAPPPNDQTPVSERRSAAPGHEQTAPSREAMERAARLEAERLAARAAAEAMTRRTRR